MRPRDKAVNSGDTLVVHLVYYLLQVNNCYFFNLYSSLSNYDQDSTSVFQVVEFQRQLLALHPGTTTNSATIYTSATPQFDINKFSAASNDRSSPESMSLKFYFTWS